MTIPKFWVYAITLAASNICQHTILQNNGSSILEVMGGKTLFAESKHLIHMLSLLPAKTSSREMIRSWPSWELPWDDNSGVFILQAQILCAPGQRLHMNVLIIKLLPRMICFSVRLPPTLLRELGFITRGQQILDTPYSRKQVIMMYTQFQSSRDCTPPSFSQ